jgi:F-type H+-transporting ATPase subunit b
MRRPTRERVPALALAASVVLASALSAAPAAAQEAAEQTPGLMSPNPGLMIWTLVIFALLFFVLKRFAFPPILGAVEARERALTEAIEGARRDREEAARMLAEQRAALDASRGEAQQLLAQARAAGEKMRADMLEQTRQQQAELLERARRDIDTERLRAIADLRREAVDLALAGASKVIGRNLDEAGNRRLVEDFLATVPPVAAAQGGR